VRGGNHRERQYFISPTTKINLGTGRMVGKAGSILFLGGEKEGKADTNRKRRGGEKNFFITIPSERGPA